jgi:hypothetical protein
MLPSRIDEVLMAMNDDKAAAIAIACVKTVGKHDPVSIGDQLGSVGVGSTGLVASLIDKICNDGKIGVPSAEFQIKPSEFGTIKTTSTVVDVSNVIAKQANPKVQTAER